MTTTSPHETELKFEVPPQALSLVIDTMATGISPLELQAIYFDSPDRALSRSKLSLLLRREGDRWLQTLKAPGASVLGRLEDEVELAVPLGGTTPELDLERHVFGKDRHALRTALGLKENDAWPALQPMFEVRVQRRAKTIKHGTSSIELALDEGLVVAAGRSRPIRELELELVKGGVVDLLGAARQWCDRHGLWLNAVSKAERGMLLLNGELYGPPTGAAIPLWAGDGKPSRGEFTAAVLDTCLDQVVRNGSEIASGSQSDDHVHQLRVGIRRLRTALREFPALAEARKRHEPVLVDVFRALGERRDRTHVLKKIEPIIEAAGGSPLRLPAGFHQGVDPIDLVQGAAFQTVLLDLLEEAQIQRDGKGRHLRGMLRTRLDMLHERVVRGGKRFVRLSEEQQHQVRKRLKRLRYLSEFSAALFGEDKAKSYLQQLKPAQDALGDYNDGLMAQQLLEQLVPTDPNAAFGIEYLKECRGDHVKACRKSLRHLTDAKRFWD